MTEPVIYVRNFGGLANRMLRYMFADFLSRKAGGVKVTGFSLPEWGLVSPEQETPTGRGVATGRVHDVNIDVLIEGMQSGTIKWVDVDCYAMRLEYFGDRKAFFAELFTAERGHEIYDDEIAINIRTGDILNGLHPDYTPLPLAFYHRLVFETGLKPVFVGQVTGNWYADALHQQFQYARFVEGDSLTDFQTVRGAKSTALAVSSFSWLATFLSIEARHIHFPVAGLFNPRCRADINMLPIDDNRYRFYKFPMEKYVASDDQKAVLTSAPAWAPQQATTASCYMGMYRAAAKPRIHSASDVAAQISAAVQERRPFSFVRLGDGEGNLLQFDPSTAQSVDIDYFKSHFGEQISLDAILAIKKGLERTISASDLIGIRDDIWLATNNVLEMNENSPDFYRRFRDEFPLRARERNLIDEYGARRVFRLFEWACESYPTEIDACSQWVCYDLATDGFWKRLFRNIDTIGLIHCSPTLPAELSRAVGVRVESFIVPDKAISRAQWTSRLPDQPPHYPDAFLRICEQLYRIAEGKVFLVGAGLAGKEYLKIIKDNGGIGLDLGALLDAWEGRATRPQIYAHKTANRWTPGDVVPSELKLE
jgi:hypothetical protein